MTRINTDIVFKGLFINNFPVWDKDEAELLLQVRYKAGAL
jgi:hypothetical protein